MYAPRTRTWDLSHGPLKIELFSQSCWMNMGKETNTHMSRIGLPCQRLFQFAVDQKGRRIRKFYGLVSGISWKSPWFVAKIFPSTYWRTNRLSHGTDPPAHWSLDAIPETPPRYLKWSNHRWFVLIVAHFSKPIPQSHDESARNLEG